MEAREDRLLDQGYYGVKRAASFYIGQDERGSLSIAPFT